MNAFEMNQRAFGVAAGGSLPPTSRDLKPSWISAQRRGRVFQVSKKPSNAAVFLVSFLSYLIGIFPSMVFALPTGGTVKAGSATINQPSSQQMTIQQTTEKAIIDWKGFGIESAEKVDFQLTQGGVTLNRVTGNDVSNIFGKLTSNGDLWLINPNGILFGANSQVDVHGLFATTSDISNADFLSSNYNFGIPSSLSSTVINQGSITASEGGLVALVAPGVQNRGIITARLGKVSLASGTTFTVDLYGDQLINLGVDSKVMGQVTGMDGEVLPSLVTNSGSIFADGGTVRLGVNAAQGIVDRVINMDGVIQAHSVSERNGAIILSGGDAGEVHVTGTLDASGYGEGKTGGTVHVLGDDRLAFYGNGLIDVSGDMGGGTLLFGGDYQGQGSVPNAKDVFVGPNAQTFADAVTNGNGGKLIFWADRRMRFYGIVKGRGGKYFGDGGFVEVSGKEELYFDGFVDTTAANGKTGTLLLDPDNLTIAQSSGASSSAAVTVDFVTTTNATIFESTLEGASQFTNVVLLANKSITLGKNSNEQINLDMQQGSGNSVTFKVTNGTISFANTLSSVSTKGGDIIFNASGELSLGSLTSNGGDISLTGSDLTLLNTATNLGAGTGNINITEAKLGDIGLGNATCTGTCGMTISNADLAKMSGNKLIINGSSSNGAIYVNGVTQATSTFSNGVELKDAHISGVKGGIFFQGASTFSTLTAESVNGMEVNANLTTTAGALALDGDSNDVAQNLAPNDSMTIANGVTLTSASNISLSATTSGISAAGALTLTAPSSITLTGNLTAVGAVDLTANSGITLNNNITSSSSLNIDANSSTLSLASGVVLSSAGALILAASNASSLGALSLTSTGSTINVNSALTSTGAVAMTANSGLNLNNTALTGTGDITLQGGTGLTLASGMGITSSAGSITLGASSGTIDANGELIISSNGSITVSNTFTSAGAATLKANSGITIGTNFTANGTVTMDADLDNNGTGDFTMSAGALSTTNNALTVTANDLALTGTIDSGIGSTTISASDGGSLSIGLTGTGMSIDNATELGKIQGIGDINLLNGNIVVASGTTVSSSGNLTLGQSGGTITGQGTLVLTGANGLVINSNTVSATGLLTLNATTGGISTPGAITLNATDGITINDTFTTAGATTIDADSDASSTGTLTVADVLSTGNNTLSITAVELALNNTLNSGTAGTTILSSQSTHTIGLGVASGNNMTLDNTDLGNIIAGSLTIGGGTNGNVNVDGVLSANSDQFGLLTLNATASGSSVTFGTTDSSFQGLTVNAGDGIRLSSNLTSNGAATFNADSNSTGTGSFTINSLKALNTTNSTLSITSKSISLNSNGVMNSGTAGTTLQVSQSGDTIGLGGGAGTFSLSSNDVAQITASDLTIGSAANGTITVDGVTSTSTPLILIATKGTSAVNFSSNASSLSNLTLDAGTGGVDFGANVSTSGDMNVTSGGTITDTGTLTIAGTSSFTTNVANQAITLDNTSNSFIGAVSLNTTGTGNATLASNNAVILSTSTVGSNLDVTVGGDNSLNVEGSAAVGGSINLVADDDIIFTAAGDLNITTNGNIIVTADNDLDKNGSGGALTMVDGTVFNAGLGVLDLSADEDITLGRVETNSASDTAVTLTSNSGGAVDGDTASPPKFTSTGGNSNPWLDIDAANGRLVADVVTGFGADNPIETKVKSLDIDNSTSGETDIFEFDELDIFKINNAGGSTEVSFEGELTGQTNCVGTCLFVRRDLRNVLIGSKTLGQLANASNEQHEFDIFELNGQNFYDKIPVDHVPSSPNGPFTADLFSEKFELVELAAGTGGKFDGMEVSQAFWGGAKQPTLEVAEWDAPDKKTRSRQRLAKRKKRIGKKVDDTASITMTKSIRKAPKPRIQKSESGYLGFAP